MGQMSSHDKIIFHKRFGAFHITPRSGIFFIKLGGLENMDWLISKKTFLKGPERKVDGLLKKTINLIFVDWSYRHFWSVYFFKLRQSTYVKWPTVLTQKTVYFGLWPSPSNQRLRCFGWSRPCALWRTVNLQAIVHFSATLHFVDFQTSIWPSDLSVFDLFVSKT